MRRPGAGTVPAGRPNPSRIGSAGPTWRRSPFPRPVTGPFRECGPCRAGPDPWRSHRRQLRRLAAPHHGRWPLPGSSQPALPAKRRAPPACPSKPAHTRSLLFSYYSNHLNTRECAGISYLGTVSGQSLVHGTGSKTTETIPGKRGCHWYTRAGPKSRLTRKHSDHSYKALIRHWFEAVWNRGSEELIEQLRVAGYFTPRFHGIELCVWLITSKVVFASCYIQHAKAFFYGLGRRARCEPDIRRSR